MKLKRIGLALTGASGAGYFLRMLERLRGRDDVEVHLICSGGGRRVLVEENGMRWQDLDLEGFIEHADKNIGASIASGSNALDAFAIIPCSMHTLASIAYGVAGTLIHRTASVQLKEGRKLLLVIRETPLSVVNMQSMVTLGQAGAVIMPASPGFYHNPQTIEDLLDTIVDRVFDHLGLNDPEIRRWQS